MSEIEEAIKHGPSYWKARVNLANGPFWPTGRGGNTRQSSNSASAAPETRFQTTPALSSNAAGHANERIPAGSKIATSLFEDPTFARLWRTGSASWFLPPGQRTKNSESDQGFPGRPSLAPRYLATKSRSPRGQLAATGAGLSPKNRSNR